MSRYEEYYSRDNRRPILAPNRPFGRRMDFYDDNIINFSSDRYAIMDSRRMQAKRQFKSDSSSSKSKKTNPSSSNSKKPKYSNESTYKESIMAVVSSDYPHSKLKDKASNYIREKVTEHLEAIKDTLWGSNMSFNKMEDKYGALFVLCDNTRTVNWFWETVHTLELPLRVVETKFLLNLHEVAVLIPKKNSNTDDATTDVLRNENPDLKIGEWLFIKAENKGSEESLKYILDNELFHLLKEKQFKGLYKSQTVTFTF